MSSLLNAAEPSPQPESAPPVNGVAVIQSDVNPAGAQCTYTAQCQSISCSDVKDYNTGTLLTVQRFLAYQTVVNFNNYLYNIYGVLFKSGDVAALISPDIVKIFYVDPTPSATWEQIIGAIAPMLGIGAAAIGPLGEAAAGTGAALGVFSGLFSQASGVGTLDQLAAISEASFNEYASIGDYIGTYVQNATSAISNCYNTTIGPQTDITEWAGDPDAPTDQQAGLFGDGVFSDSDFAQSLTRNVQTTLAKIFAYKAINFGLVDSSNFIMYVPYDRPVMGADGNMIPNGIDQQFCRSQLQDTSNTGSILICDAPGPGMARIFNGNAVDASSLENSLPQGWNSNLQIVAGVSFNMGDAIRGSVASWQAGDFGYDVADPYTNALNTGNLSPRQLTQLSQLSISATTPGFFNIPVCRLFDLRAFPPASGLGCTACGTNAAVGGTNGSTATFWDHVNQTIQDVLESYPNGVQCAETTCDDFTCNFDRFDETASILAAVSAAIGPPISPT